MTPKEKLAVVQSFASEIIKEDELLALFEKIDKGEKIIAYDGFEPSGQIHIAQGLMRAITVNKLTDLGITFKFWVADWFGMLNGKMGGDLEKIRVVGEYFIEVWKACGMDMSKVEFVWTSEFINTHPEYWDTVLKLSMNATVQRVLRCGQIMGREESTNNPASQILYPIMQAADIHHLDADIAQLGMDQRKVNMLARDVFPKIGLKPPVAVHHHMLLGLHEQKPDMVKEFNELIGQVKKETVDAALLKVVSDAVSQYLPDTSVTIYDDKKQTVLELLEIRDKISTKIQTNNKMSKSKPNSAIFMTDSSDDVKRKFKKAYCPEKQVEDNPVLEYLKYIVFEKFDSITVSRLEKFGGDVTFDSYDSLETAFVAGEVHPMDVKATTAKYVDELLAPIREHFEKDSKAKALAEKVKGFAVTR